MAREGLRGKPLASRSAFIVKRSLAVCVYPLGDEKETCNDHRVSF
jgi:hypothetical protein